MKIFNWVHRKLHHKEGKKADSLATEAETEVLLTIGTFGLDPWSEFKPQSEYPVVQNEEEEEEEEEEYEIDDCQSESDVEEDPLMSAAFGFRSVFDGKQEEEKRERVTLADLFSADSEDYHHKKPDQNKEKPEDDIHAKKKSLSSAKKIIPRVADDKRPPIKKLHQLMSRMLKRKIHPDLGGKLARTESGLLADEENGANELVCLLQSKEVIWGPSS